jgi:hypothetical protein
MSDNNIGLFSNSEQIAEVKRKALSAIAELDSRKRDREKQREESSQRWKEWKAKSWWYRLTHTYDAPYYNDFVESHERNMRNILIDVVHMITLNPQEIRLTADTCWHIEFLNERFDQRKVESKQQ